MVRIDHFCGFWTYYSIPFGAKDAIDGIQISAPGKELFNKVNCVLDGDRIIDEN